MATFDDALRSIADAFNVAFGESVTVTPKGGAARTVTAVVDRNPPESFAGGEVHKPSATFLLKNHATEGITMAETATGLTVTYDRRYGDATSRRTEQAHLVPDDSDAGSITLEV